MGRPRPRRCATPSAWRVNSFSMTSTPRSSGRSRGCRWLALPRSERRFAVHSSLINDARGFGQTGTAGGQLSSGHSMSSYGVTIAGTGSYVPERVLTNAELETMVETTDEWIRTRTGIEERHIARPDEPCSAIACEAAKRALAAANLKPEDLDLILVATFTGDN